MSAVPKCTSWLGHKFRARYSVTNPALSELVRTVDKIDVTAATIKVMQDETYVCDICVRCGHVVERKTAEEGTK